MQEKTQVIRVRRDTYKRLKHIAVDEEISLIELLDQLVKVYKKEEGLSSPA